jgi:predicted transcriptional regulator
MARKPSKNLTERELEIMQVLWSLREARLGEIQEALNQSGEPVAPSTVATQLNLLIHKGYVTQAGRPGRSLYLPTCSREEATKNLLDDFLARVGLGRAPGFLIQMLKNEQLTAEDRAALQNLLRESEPESHHRPRPRSSRPRS